MTTRSNQDISSSQSAVSLNGVISFVKNNFFATVLCLCCIFGLVLAVPVNRFFGAAVFLLGLTAGFEIWRYRMPFSYCPQRVFAVLSFLAVCWLSAFFAEYTEEAASRATKLSAYALSCIVVFSILKGKVKALSKTAQNAIIFAFFTGAAILYFEVSSGYMLHKLIRGLDAGHVVNIHSSNPGGIVLAILSWPVLVLAYKTARAPYALLIYLVTLMTAFNTSSESAQLGVLLGGAVAVMAAFTPKKVLFYGFSTLWTLGMALTPWIAQYLFAVRPSAFLKGSIIGPATSSGGHRLEIWDGVARLALEKPFFGHGLGSTKFLQLDIDGEFFPLLEATHPHNMPLELWIDFGMVGVFLGALVPVYVAARIRRYSGVVYCAMIGCFSTVLMVSLSGHGAWQSWWLGAIIFAAFLLKFLAVSEGQPKDKKGK